MVVDNVIIVLITPNMNYDSSKKKLKINFSKSLFINKSFSGFTIVELLVTMSIMAIAFGLVTVNYRDFQRAKQLENARREVITAMRRAQQLASSGVQPSGCNELIEVQFILSATDDGYRYRARCGDADQNGQGDIPVDYPDQTTFSPLPEGVEVATGGSVHFRNSVVGGTRNQTITLGIRNSAGDTETITVYPGGRIE